MCGCIYMCSSVLSGVRQEQLAVDLAAKSVELYRRLAQPYFLQPFVDHAPSQPIGALVLVDMGPHCGGNPLFMSSQIVGVLHIKPNLERMLVSCIMVDMCLECVY